MECAMRSRGLVLLTLPVFLASPAAADAPSATNPATTQSPSRDYDVVLEVGGGAALRPAYEGASEYQVSPFPVVTLHYLWLPGLGEVKGYGRPRDGFSVGPSFRYVRARNSGDYSELTGLQNVDPAYELGGRVAYTFGVLRAHASLRRGIGGHEGLVGEAGLDLTLYPNAVTELNLGPRISYANAAYMRTYLGVTPAESLTSGLPAYDPGGGIKGAGVEFGGRYAFTPQWSLLGAVTYERLVGDAAASPIAQAGDLDQFTARLGLSYRFGLNLFN
jgi:outer membrane protein